MREIECKTNSRGSTSDTVLAQRYQPHTPRNMTARVRQARYMTASPSADVIPWPQRTQQAGCNDTTTQEMVSMKERLMLQPKKAETRRLYNGETKGKRGKRRRRGGIVNWTFCCEFGFRFLTRPKLQTWRRMTWQVHVSGRAIRLIDTYSSSRVVSKVLGAGPLDASCLRSASQVHE